jgi:conflict system STAND superfamily ATPase
MTATFSHSNPYIGPRAFQIGEGIFGRDQEILKIFYQLISERIVLLYSQSGAGKTSLIQAGLIPKLREAGFLVFPIIRVGIEPPPDLLEKQPINRYLYSMLLSISEDLPQKEYVPVDQSLDQSLNEYLPRLAGTSISQQGKSNVTAILIFDQFEEVFTTDPVDLDGKLMFFKQLGDALRNPSRWALFVLREDFVAYLDSYKHLLPTGLQSTFHLQRLQPDAALQAIQLPARTAGLNFTDTAAQKLVDDLRRVKQFQPDRTVVDALGYYIEPTQLQLVCHNLWNNLPADKTEIDEKDLAYLGDTSQALVDYYADQMGRVAAQTKVRERAIRQWFETKLIGPGGTRNIVPMVTVDLPDMAVQLLQNTALVRAERRGGQLWLELTHDRLVEPILVNNRTWFEQNLSPLQRQATLWNTQGRNESWLLTGQALAEMEQRAKDYPDELTREEMGFLQASTKKELSSTRERRRFRITVILIAIQAVMIIVLAILLILAIQK